jgi:monoamine oxidase
VCWPQNHDDKYRGEAEDMTVHEGAMKICQSMAHGIDIRYNAIVQSITHNSAGVTIQTTDHVTTNNLIIFSSSSLLFVFVVVIIAI